MTEKTLDDIAWEAFEKATGNERHKLEVSIDAVFDHIHDNIQHFDKKYHASANWQEIWNEILAWLTTHIPNANNLPFPTPKSG